MNVLNNTNSVCSNRSYFEFNKKQFSEIAMIYPKIERNGYIMANRYEAFREQMVSQKNQFVLDLMNELDELETRKYTEEDIATFSEKVSNLEANGIIKGRLSDKLKKLQRRIDRTVPADFGAYLLYLRKKNGYTLKNIEQETGLSTSYVNRLENSDKLNPSYSVLAKLAQIYGVPIYEMLDAATNELSARDIIEILSFTPFTIKGHQLEDNEKESLVEIIQTIIESDWTEEAPFRNAIDLMEKLDNMKRLISNRNQENCK